MLRNSPPETHPLGRIGRLETRLANGPREIRAAQAVRYRVFCDELGARVPRLNRIVRRDFDAFDEICDHLLVLDRSIDGPPEDQIVGTYRLLTDRAAAKSPGFYSASEFAIGDLVERHPGKRFMELGRSCVLPAYRTRRTLELLWQGNWAYALSHGIDVMFGCGSFSGTDPGKHALALSFLHHFCKTRGEWAVSALPEYHRRMDIIPAAAIEARSALGAMPPLIKGYLRLGAMVGEGAFIDRDFRTTDVIIVLPVENISQRYLNYYGADGDRFAVSVARCD